MLRRTRYPLPLTEFVHDFMAGTLRQDAVSVTFDDGYVDNLAAGKPCLVAADVPATIFLATGYLNSPGAFWWDELQWLVLLGECPQRFELVVRGTAMDFDFETDLRTGRKIPRRGGALR